MLVLVVIDDCIVSLPPQCIITLPKLTLSTTVQVNQEKRTDINHNFSGE